MALDQQAGSYDVLILGGGPAATHCSGFLADAGRHVAIVEGELLGGECDYYACMPSKTLLRPGEALAAARDAPGASERVADGPIAPAGAFGWRDFMVNNYDDGHEVAWAESKGVEIVRGHGRLAGPGVIEVGGRRLVAADIVVATGSSPSLPPVPGLEELVGLWSNREATGATEVPERLLIMGGGPVGVEMAQVFRSLGSEVVVVEGQDRLLPHSPRALGEALGTAFEADGIELHLGAQVTAARRDGDDYVLALGQEGEVRGDRLLVATGRRPRMHDIGLETVGLDPGARQIDVDASMRAGEGLWAIGDVTGIWLLTYVGKYQGRVAAANILGEPTVADYSAVPTVVFTHPQAAAVGEAEGALSATVSLASVARTYTYMRHYEDRPDFLTLVSDGRRLTGAYALGPEAGEWLQQATLAIRAKVPLEVFFDTIQPFPSFSEVFLSALIELRSKARQSPVGT